MSSNRATNAERRGEILNLRNPVDSDYENVPTITLKQFELLVEENLIVTDYQFNSSPMMMQFLLFMRKYPKVIAHGYVIGSLRIDCRITIEGLKYKGVISKEMKLDFSMAFMHADEFESEDEYLRCWWDRERRKGK